MPKACQANVFRARCWPGGTTPLEPPDGPRPGSSVTGPWPCWPGGTTPLEPPDGPRPGSSVTGPWPCWPGGTTPANVRAALRGHAVLVCDVTQIAPTLGGAG